MTEQTSPVPMEPSIEHAPLPTAKTLRRRRSVLVQLVRFASLNLRMAYLAVRGHK